MLSPSKIAPTPISTPKFQNAAPAASNNGNRNVVRHNLAISQTAVPIPAMDAQPIVVPPGQGHRVGNVEFLARTADTPRFTFGIIEIAPGRVLEEHVHHEEDDAFYIIQGEMIFTFGDEEVYREVDEALDEDSLSLNEVIRREFEPVRLEVGDHDVARSRVARDGDGHAADRLGA